MTIAEAVATADAVKGAMSRAELTWLAQMAQRLEPTVWVEIGSWRGRSATAVAAMLPPGSRLHLIDPLVGQTSLGEPDVEMARARLHAQINAMRVMNPHITIRHHETPSIEAAGLFERESVDVVFVDGNHKYGYVQGDILGWRPILRENGLLCGHDFGPPCGVERAVTTWLPQARRVPGTTIFATTVRHLQIGSWDLDDLVCQLERLEPFVFTRWGDGEWSGVFGDQGQNCDGHAYTDALREDLRAVLLDHPSYRLGLQGLAVRRMGPRIVRALERLRVWPEWVDADILHRASQHGRLDGFLAALKNRRLVVVGPSYLREAPCFEASAHVDVPEQNCHEDLERVLAETWGAVYKLKDDHPVVLASAGMSANVILHRLERVAPYATSIDCGSLWDPYTGRQTRTYHGDVLSRV